MGTWLENAVNTMLLNYVVKNSDAVIAVFTPIVLTALGIYVFWTGYQVMSGLVEDSLGAVFRRWLRYAIVSGIALNGQVYRSIVQDGLEGIQGAFGAAFGMGPTVGSAVDGMLDPFLTMTNTLWSTAMTGLVWPAFNLMIAGVFYAVAGALMAIVSLCLSLLAKIILSVLLAIGPVFMFCALFPTTQRYAENWVMTAFGAIFTNVMLVATITVLTSIVRSVCQGALTSYSVGNPVSDSIGVLLVAASCAYILMHAQSVASGLAGGLAIGNLGNEVGRPMAGGMGKALWGSTVLGADMARSLAAGWSRFFPTANHMSQGTKSAIVALPTPGSAPTPLYQRGLIERLRNG
ncbi:MAG: type IV secretion system protein [Nitrospira sp.]